MIALMEVVVPPFLPRPMVGYIPWVAPCSVGYVELYGLHVDGLRLVILEGLRVDAVLQHPALVVVCTHPELALLVGVHGAVLHAEAPVGRHVSTALEGPLVPLPAQLVLALVNSLGGHLGLPAGLVLHVVALAA